MATLRFEDGTIIDDQAEVVGTLEGLGIHLATWPVPDVPDLDGKLAKFLQCHIHPDNEIRYIVDGSGVFGVVLPDGGQVELAVEAPEYICVPAGTEHWFRLDDRRRIKAIRIFMETQGWEADFTGTEIRMGRR